jgi:hypothetical protein
LVFFFPSVTQGHGGSSVNRRRIQVENMLQRNLSIIVLKPEAYFLIRILRQVRYLSSISTLIISKGVPMKRTILIMTFIFAMGFQDSFAMHNHFTFTHMIKNSILQTYKPDILLPTNYKSLDGFLYQNQDIKTVLKQFLAFKKKIPIQTMDGVRTD